MGSTTASKVWGIIRQILTFGGPVLVATGVIPEGFWEIIFAWIIPVGASIVGIINKDSISEAATSLGRHSASFILGSLHYWGLMEQDPEFNDLIITFAGNLGIIIVSIFSKVRKE